MLIYLIRCVFEVVSLYYMCGTWWPVHAPTGVGCGEREREREGGTREIYKERERKRNGEIES